MNDKGIIENLKQHSEFKHELIDEVVPQVQADTFQEDISPVELIQNEIRQCWNIRKNIVSRNLEIEVNNEFVRMENHHFNDIFLRVKKHIHSASFDIIERIIISSDTPQFNPLLDFLNAFPIFKTVSRLIFDLIIL